AHWQTAAKYFLGLALLAFVLWWYWGSKFDADGKLIGPGLKDTFQKPIRWTPFLLAAGVWTVGLLITFYRWYILVRALDLPFRLRDALRLGLIGCYFNAYLPGSVGGDILKAAFIAREKPGRRTAAVATVLMDRGV